MKTRCIILVMILAFSCNGIFAQKLETDYDTLYKKELARQDSLNNVLQSLKNRQKLLAGITGSDSSKLTKKKNAKIKELEAKKTEYDRLLSRPNYKKLQDLLNKQKRMESQITSLSADTTNLVAKISFIDGQIAQLSGNIAELESIKDNVSNQLLAENQGILDKPFSQLTIDELTAIKTKCSKFSIDQKIKALIAKADKVLNNKYTYDKAIRILNSKYDKVNLIRINESLTRVYSTNSIQQSEINQVRGLLSHFESGMATFKLFIQEINRRRDGASSYSKDDLSHDLSKVQDKLKKKINSEIMQVPYLKKAYNDYINAITAKPMSHPAIESEILNYSN